MRVYLLFLIVLLAGCSEKALELTTASASPDGKMTAQLLELPASFDRNFTVQITREGQSPIIVLERSPDEGRPEGTERFIWSENGEFLLLVGREFFAEPKISLESGETCYLLFQVPQRSLWLNAQQSRIQKFQLETLSEVEWTEPMTFSITERGIDSAK